MRDIKNFFNVGIHTILRLCLSLFFNLCTIQSHAPSLQNNLAHPFPSVYHLLRTDAVFFLYANIHIAPPNPANNEANTTPLPPACTIVPPDFPGTVPVLGTSSTLTVGLSVVGDSVGKSVCGLSVGALMGLAVGTLLGLFVGVSVGTGVLGLAVGGIDFVGVSDGGEVGAAEELGTKVG